MMSRFFETRWQLRKQMDTFTNNKPVSVIGRLLEELSWVGSTIKAYRHGGRGYENVLTAEALQALDFLPRGQFLGEVLQQCTGADAARRKLTPLNRRTSSCSQETSIFGRVSRCIAVRFPFNLMGLSAQKQHMQ